MKKAPLFLMLFTIAAIASWWLLPVETPSNTALPTPEEDKTFPSDWMYDQRAYPDNHFDYEAYQHAIQQTQKAKADIALRNSEDWELAGPLNTGGRITDIRIHPQNPDIIYAGASVGGIFKSEDRGITWAPIFDDQGVASIGNMAIAPSNPDMLYVGTGEANGSATSGAFFGNGVYRTPDGGDSWEYLGLANSQHIGRIAVDPTNADRVFVAAAGLLYGKSEDKGLYRTTDGGQNWEKVLFISDSTSVIDVVIHPTNPDILYAASWERIRFPWQRSYGGVTSGIHRSTDGGDTWELLTNGLPPNDTERGRIGLAISASEPDILYASYTTNAITNVFDGVYKTENGGDDWFRVDDGSISNVYSSFGWFFGNLRVDPNDSDVIYLMGVIMYKSVDGGANWIDITNMHVDQHGLESHPTDSEFVVAGNDGGVYLSTNGGFVWDHVQVLPITQFYNCEIDPQNPDRLYGGTQDNGTIRTPDGAIDGYERILGGDGFHVIVDPTDSDIIYCEFQFGNLFRSFDGNNFDFIFDGGEGDRTNWNTPVVMDPTFNAVLYYGSNILYRTEDFGSTWSAISPDLTDGQHPSGSGSYGTITTIAVSASNPEVVYVGTDDGNVQVTQNAGTSWTNISAGLPDRFVTEVAVDENDPNTAFVTLSGYRNVDYQPHVLMTQDAGANWIDISGNLPEIPINDIIIDPDIPNTLYIGNDLGVWFTQDLGVSWNVLGNNFPLTIVNDLDFHQPTRTLVAATFGRSLQKIDVSFVVSNTTAEQALANTQLQIFPNPARENTNIQFELASSEQVTIELYSENGQKIRRIFEGQLSDGAHQIEVNTAILAKGKYLVRMVTPNLIKTAFLLKQ